MVRSQNLWVGCFWTHAILHTRQSVRIGYKINKDSTFRSYSQMSRLFKSYQNGHTLYFEIPKADLSMCDCRRHSFHKKWNDFTFRFGFSEQKYCHIIIYRLGKLFLTWKKLQDRMLSKEISKFSVLDRWSRISRIRTVNEWEQNNRNWFLWWARLSAGLITLRLPRHHPVTPAVGK